jgi:hypothetical protein
MVSDLCKRCIHFTICTRYDQFDQSIVYCEDFAHTDKRGYVKYSGALKGLCKTCRKRFICLVQKPDAGVWHCEAYE